MSREESQDGLGGGDEAELLTDRGKGKSPSQSRTNAKRREENDNARQPIKPEYSRAAVTTHDHKSAKSPKAASKTSSKSTSSATKPSEDKVGTVVKISREVLLPRYSHSKTSQEQYLQSTSGIKTAQLESLPGTSQMKSSFSDTSRMQVSLEESLPGTSRTKTPLINTSQDELRSRTSKEESFSRRAKTLQESFSTTSRDKIEIKISAEEEDEEGKRRALDFGGYSFVVLPPRVDDSLSVEAVPLAESVSARPRPFASTSTLDVPLRRPYMMGQSGINLRSSASGTLLNRMVSSLIQSVASTHAAGFVDSSMSNASRSTDRSHGHRLSGTAERNLLERSVWKDPEVEDLLRTMRMDALGDVIWSKEASESVLFEGPTTQFELHAVKPSIEKEVRVGSGVDQLVFDAMRFETEHGSQPPSLLVTPSPPTIQRSVPASIQESSSRVDKTSSLSTEGVTASVQILPMLPEEIRSPSLQTQWGSDKDETQTPEPCVIDPCFIFPKEEITSEELCYDSVSSSARVSTDRKPFPDKRARPALHVKFRLATGQAFKRIYEANVSILDVMSDLSRFLDAPNDSLRLFLENQPLNPQNFLKQVSKDRKIEILVEATMSSAKVLSLVEQGLIYLDDDSALRRFLKQSAPCAPKKKFKKGPFISQQVKARQPESFLPRLVDYQEKNQTISPDLQKTLDDANRVKRIQSSFWCYLSKRMTPKQDYCNTGKMRKPLNETCNDDREECSKNLRITDEHGCPRFLTKEDFATLYNLLNEWWREEADAIKRDNSSAAKTSRLFNLLLKEIEYMRVIEKYRSELKEEARTARMVDLLEKIAKCASEKTDNAEWLQGFLSPWQKVQILSELKGIMTNCHQNQRIASKICQLFDCEKYRGHPDIVSCLRETISQTMSDVLRGTRPTKKTWNKQFLCQKCRRILPSSRFRIHTGIKVINTCEKCQRLDNMARERKHLTDIRNIIEDVRGREMKLGSESRIPFIMQEEDFEKLLNLWHNVSALSGDACELRLVRWDPCVEWSPWNTLLLSGHEVEAHCQDRYADDFVETVRKRNLAAKRMFANLIELEKAMKRNHCQHIAGKSAETSGKKTSPDVFAPSCLGKDEM